MANVRCPMCSKVNPPEAEVCSYCGARLKPLHLGQSGQPTPGPAKSDEPDWLSQLRTDGPGSVPDVEKGKPAEPAASSSDVPDWLSRIRDRAKTETSGQEEEPDWMKGLQSEAPADQGLDDWLSRIPGSQTAEPGGAKPPAQPPAPGKSEPKPEPPASSLEPADWLRGLSDEPAAGTTSAGTPAFDFGSSETGETGEDDWMSKLSDWNADLPGQDAENPPAETPAFTSQDEFGWLDEQADAPKAPEAPSTPHEQPFTSGTGLTGFLARFEQPAQDAPPGKDAFSWDALQEGASQQGVPQEGAPQESGPFEGGIEWSMPEAEAPADQPSSGFGLTGFLSNLDKSDATQEPPDETASGQMSEDAFPGWEQAPAPGEGLPDWFSSGQPAQEEAAPPAGSEQAPAAGLGETDLSDWLKSMESETPGQTVPGPFAAEETGASAPTESETGIPDWLKGTAEEPSPPQRESGPIETGAAGLPSWLSDLDKAETPAAQPPEQPAAGNSDLPSWLFGSDEETKPQAPVSEPAGQKTPQAAQPPSAAQPPVAPSTMTQPADQAPSEEPQEESIAAMDLPTWLSSDFGSAAETGSVPEENSSAQGETSLPMADAGSLPDWFSSFDQKDVEKTQPSRTGRLNPIEPGKPESGQQPPAAGADEGGAILSDDVPDWLQGFQGEQKTDATGEAISQSIGGDKALDTGYSKGTRGAESEDQPFTVDLPAWLGEDAEAQQAETAEQPTETSGEQLAQAELPEWVKEMRPLESILPGAGEEVQPGEVDQRVEKSGPLAGMRGVLPVEDMASRYRKPPIYSVKLRVTEKQRTQATLLESILAQESQPLLIPPEHLRATGMIVRVLIALFIIVALAYPVVFNVSALAMPSTDPKLSPAENQMYQKINESLQTNAPVLLAVEYEPALSGEMRLAAGAVIDQLVAKNARLVIISTTPAGPALGQQLLDDAIATYKDYKVADQVVNLGYLPGGTISLVDFAQQPNQASPYTLDFKPAWTTTFLQKIAGVGLGGFSQVIVLTDRAEVGRAWVEQVQPKLGKVPLLVVASAQAAPLLQPYYESGQIAGMTSGMLGGVIYAQMTKQTNSRALLNFPAYQIGVVLAFAVVLVGGIISGAMSLFKPKNREEE